MNPFRGELKKLMAHLHAAGYRPSRRLGQNFITDPNLLHAIVREADLCADDRVLEVGTGSGWLTRLLAGEAGSVLSIEIDRRLHEHCRRYLSDLENVTLMHGDVLETKNRLNAQLLEKLAEPTRGLRPLSGSRRLKVVANLPFQISAPFLVLIHASDLRPATTVVTLQHEMAQRLVAEPGTKQYGSITAMIRFFCTVKIVRRIRARQFWPVPKVDATVVRLDARDALPECDFAQFQPIARAIFSHRRKTLPSALKSGLRLKPEDARQAVQRAGLDPALRVGGLSVDQIAALANALR